MTRLAKALACLRDKTNMASSSCRGTSIVLRMAPVIENGMSMMALVAGSRRRMMPKGAYPDNSRSEAERKISDTERFVDKGRVPVTVAAP